MIKSRVIIESSHNLFLNNLNCFNCAFRGVLRSINPLVLPLVRGIQRMGVFPQAPRFVWSSFGLLTI